MRDSPPCLKSYLRPRTLPIPGFDLENVFLLRDPSQANKIAEMGVGKNVVVIGTSFIGMIDSSRSNLLDYR